MTFVKTNLSSFFYLLIKEQIYNINKIYLKRNNERKKENFIHKIKISQETKLFFSFFLFCSHGLLS